MTNGRDPGAVARLQRAQKLSAALFGLSTEQGAGALVCARTVADELARHELARGRFEAGTADRADWERFYGSAGGVVIAIGQILAFERRVRRLTNDRELEEARREFDEQVPHAKAIRDLVMHLDGYAVNQGHRQTGRGGKNERPVSEPNVTMTLVWGDNGTELFVADTQVNLHAAGDASIALAHVVERVRERHRLTASREVEEALRAVWDVDV